MTTTKSSYLRMVAAAIALAIGMLCLGIAPGMAHAEGANLAAAKALYSVGDDRVVTVTAVGDLDDALDAAQREATAANKAIVYLPSGSYAASDMILVPENVVLVGESDTKITSSKNRFNNVMRLYGSIYGCSIDANYKNDTCIKLMEVSYSNMNGRIDKTSVSHAGYYGIVAIRKACRNAEVRGVTVSQCTASGIAILDGARIALIADSSFVNNGADKEGAGINLSCADVGTISNCTISGNADKAVSTNCLVSGYSQNGCTIDAITGCTMENNVVNGVYIKPYCTVNSFTNNVLRGNGDGLSAVAAAEVKGANGKYSTKTGPSVINNVSGNVIEGNVNMQVKAINKGASITILDNNVISKSKKSAGIEAAKKGKVTIKGSGNKITGNKGAGLNVSDGGKVTIKGSKNTVSGNKIYAVYCSNKGKFEVTGAKNVFKSTKSATLYVAKKGVVTITGKNPTITGKSYAIYAKGKGASVKVKKVKKLSGRVYAASKAAVKVNGKKVK